MDTSTLYGHGMVSRGLGKLWMDDGRNSKEAVVSVHLDDNDAVYIYTYSIIIYIYIYIYIYI